MIKTVKRLVFRSMSLERYLRLMQRGFFFGYDTGLLRASRSIGYHYYVKRLIKNGDTIIDIGANLGYYSILFARWTGSQGRVHSVEPIEIYNRVFNRKARRYKNITLLPYALGAEERDVELVTSPGAGYLRTGLPHIYDPARDGNLENAEFRFKARMNTPENLFGEIKRIDYVKCDIEGFEYEALKQMEPILARHLPRVQVEVWEKNEGNVLKLMEGMGYAPMRFDDHGRLLPVTADPRLRGDYIFLPPGDPLARR